MTGTISTEDRGEDHQHAKPLTYKQRHKSVSANVTIEEYAAFTALAISRGLTPSTYLTRLVRSELEPPRGKAATA